MNSDGGVLVEKRKTYDKSALVPTLVKGISACAKRLRVIFDSDVETCTRVLTKRITRNCTVYVYT